MPKSSRTIEGTLDLLCWTVAQIIQDEGDLQMWHLEAYLPSKVFMMAVATGLIPRPKEPKDKRGFSIGEFLISSQDHEAFMQSIAESLTDLRNLIAEHAEDGTDADYGVVNTLSQPKWITPTPAELIGRYRKKTGLSYYKMAEEARKMSRSYEFDDDDKAISYKTLQRMCQPGHNARTAIAHAVAKLMNLDSWIELQWREQKM
ncbi:MAG: hypothetical protein ABL967_13445 [Bryobacteraceae bacterium]